jgi:hypothetical protein
VLPPLPAGVPTPTVTPLPPGVYPPTSTEIVSARTADGDTYQGPNGSRVAVLRPNMNYQPSPGAAYQPVDLTFHSSGGAMVEDRSAVNVTISSAGIDATDHLTGAGLRLITPSLPSAAGSVAKVILGGLTSMPIS